MWRQAACTGRPRPPPGTMSETTDGLLAITGYTILDEYECGVVLTAHALHIQHLRGLADDVA